jgi:alkylation response protein AidB-like acyl-CoA dehydrogenase
MSSVELADELKMLRTSVKEFVRRELQPHEHAVDRLDHTPPDLMWDLRRKARDLGILGLTMPVEDGGSGLGAVAYCVLREELGWTSQAMSYAVRGPAPILLAGTPEQKEKFLYPCLRAEKREAFAITEPDAGSDVTAMKTTAVPRGDGFVLNGSKVFITNGDGADFTIVFAVTDPEKRGRGGITAFLVEKGTPGFGVGQVFGKMGWRGTGLVELVFSDCFVPRENILGQLGQGLALAMQWIDEGRLGISASAVGSAERMIELCARFVKERKSFGQFLADRQAMQLMLADSAMDTYAARTMVYDAAARAEAGENIRQRAAMTKIFASEMVGRIADRAVQIHGGMGYVQETPVERCYRDVRFMRIAEGTSEVLRLLVARGVLNP